MHANKNRYFQGSNNSDNPLRDNAWTYVYVTHYTLCHYHTHIDNIRFQFNTHKIWILKYVYTSQIKLKVKNNIEHLIRPINYKFITFLSALWFELKGFKTFNMWGESQITWAQDRFFKSSFNGLGFWRFL